MKKTICIATLVPGAALAHGGHPELAGPVGHTLAHVLIGGGLALALLAGASLLRRRHSPRRREE